MKTHRVKIWEQRNGVTIITEDAKQHIKRLGCLVRTYALQGDDGRHANIAVFPMDVPPVVLISPESAPWAEGAVERLFDNDGNVKPHIREQMNIHENCHSLAASRG